MNVEKVWLDLDPGVDDAVAILLAAKMPELDIQAFSATAGNVALDYTYANTRNLLAFAGLKKPVYKGSEKPLLAPPVYARSVHGYNGLCGEKLIQSEAKESKIFAWDALYEKACELDGDLSLIMTGPLTNLARALLKYEDLSKKIKRLVLMGGSVIYGNTTPSSEFNIHFDPEAADIVFNSGLDISMLGLDVTTKAVLDAEDLERLKEMNPQANFLSRCLSHRLKWNQENSGVNHVYLHDPCTLIYLIYPDIFKSEKAAVKIERKGKLTRGKTVSDLYSDFKFEDRNIDIVLDIDLTRFKEIIFSILSRY